MTRRSAHDDTLLAVEGVSVRFGGIRAVSEVSFDVAPGEVVGVRLRWKTHAGISG